MRRVVFAVCVALVGVALAGDAQSNLAGTWTIDQDRSTAMPDLTTQIVVSQSGDAVRFDYYEGKRLAASERFIADGRSRERYKTNLGKGFASARWHKGTLMIETTVAMDNEGLQSYNTSERWSVSADGKTLTMKTGDDKVKVFTRVAEAADKRE